MKTIDSYDFKGKRVLIRVDFNVPLDDNGNVTDDTRIRAAVPTIKKVLAGGGSVVLIAHMGRPKSNPDPKYTLRQIVPTVEKDLGMKIDFADDVIGRQAMEKSAALKPGQVLLLENLRFYPEEEGKPRLAADATEEQKAEAKKAVKESQKEFVKKLAKLGDVYINDAFGTAHRAHASTALIAEYFPQDKMFGYVMENELRAMDAVMKNPQHPSVAIVGGSKVSSKISILESLIEKVDSIIIGGGMTYTFMGARGGNEGDSLCEPDMFPVALAIIEKAKARGVELVFSEDTLCGDAFSEDANTRIFPPYDIPNGWEGMDIGPKTRKKFHDHIVKCKTILWNGPVGVFELEKFSGGTKAVAEAVVEATQKGAYSLVGGGDSVAAVSKYGLADQVSYVSTGGGAMLEYIEGKELPGVKAIKE